MKMYNDQNPPSSGNALVIYNALKEEGWTVKDLHYNSNCFGNNRNQGYGTWACTISESLGDEELTYELLCGIKSGTPYLQTTSAPFRLYPIKESLDTIKDK